MIIRQNGIYETNSLFLNLDWYNENNFIIDETTEQGQLMMETYINNYPLVTFEHDNKYVLSVSVIELEKPVSVEGKEIQLIKNELGQWEYVYIDIPLTKEQELEIKVAEQDAVIEEIMFVIIPTLTGGM